LRRITVTNQTNYPENVFFVRPDGRDKIDLTPETRSLDLDPAWQPVCSNPGTSGDDRLVGTTADERLCGLDGDDSLRGGAGVDGLCGGYGDDELRSVDGAFDIVGRGDLVGADCERVRRV
jgi:hypothetical protein